MIAIDLSNFDVVSLFIGVKRINFPYTNAGILQKFNILFVKGKVFPAYSSYFVYPFENRLSNKYGNTHSPSYNFSYKYVTLIIKDELKRIFFGEYEFSVLPLPIYTGFSDINDTITDSEVFILNENADAQVWGVVTNVIHGL